MAKINRNETCYVIMVNVGFLGQEDVSPDYPYVDRILYSNNLSYHYLQALKTRLCLDYDGYISSEGLLDYVISTYQFDIKISLTSFKNIETLTKHMVENNLQYRTSNAVEENTKYLGNLLEKIIG